MIGRKGSNETKKEIHVARHIRKSKKHSAIIKLLKLTQSKWKEGRKGPAEDHKKNVCTEAIKW